MFSLSYFHINCRSSHTACKDVHKRSVVGQLAAFKVVLHLRNNWSQQHFTMNCSRSKIYIMKKLKKNNVKGFLMSYFWAKKKNSIVFFYQLVSRRTTHVFPFYLNPFYQPISFDEHKGIIFLFSMLNILPAWSQQNICAKAKFRKGTGVKGF